MKHEAIMLTRNNIESVQQWVLVTGGSASIEAEKEKKDLSCKYLLLDTLSGKKEVKQGEYVVRSIGGNFNMCPREIIEKWIA